MKRLFLCLMRHGNIRKALNTILKKMIRIKSLPIRDGLRIMRTRHEGLRDGLLRLEANVQRD